MEFIEILLSISILANLILGFFVIGTVIRYHPKEIKRREKNETGALFFASIAIGGLFGFIGNLFASSVFEIAKSSSSFAWTIPVLLFLTGLIFLWVVVKTVQYSYEFMGE
jgi:cytochrome c oxidase assembly factor CtaG